MAADLWPIASGDAEFQHFTDGSVTANGSFLTTVDYRGTIDLAPNESLPNNPDILTAPAGEKADAIVRYGSDGSFQWAKQIGVLEYETGQFARGGIFASKAEIADEGFYVLGNARGIVDLDPENPESDSVIDATGLYYGKAFVARFDANTGEFEWLHDASAVGSDGFGHVTDEQMALDQAGNVYFAFGGSPSRPSSSTANLDHFLNDQPLDTSNGFYQQTFIAKISAGGDIQDVQHLGSYEAFDDVSIAMYDTTSDPDDWRLIVTGSAGGKVYLGDAESLSAQSTVGQPNAPLGDRQGYFDADIMMLALTTEGEVDWATTYEGSLRQWVMATEVDSDGTIYLQNYSYNPIGSTPQLPPLQFDPTDPTTSFEGDFVTTFDINGNFIAAEQLDADLLNSLSDGVLIEISGKTPQAVDGLLLNDNPEGDQYVLKLDKYLNATPIFRHDANLKGIDLAGDTVTAWGSFTAGEVLPGGTQEEVGGSSDAFATRFDVTQPLSLPNAELVVVFEDSFENGTNSNEWSGNWSEDSQNDWFRSTQRAWSGNRSAEVDGRASDAVLESRSIDLSEFVTAELSFSAYIESGLDLGEYIAADIWNGTSWTEIRRIKGNESTENAWMKISSQLSGEYLREDFEVRFRGKSSNSWEDANVDDIRIVGVLPTGAPNQSPIANAGVGYLTSEGTPMALDASASTDSDGTIVSFAWDFDGDGIFDDAVGSTPVFLTADSGATTVHVQVTDDDGATAIAAAVVDVQNVAPTANAGGDYSAELGMPLKLSAAASTDPGADIESYSWDLDGDGVYETQGASVSFDTSVAGSFVAELLVTDLDGASDTSSANILVSEAPSASGPNPSHGNVSTADDIWQTVAFGTSYESAVVVATPRYNAGSGPGVVRISNVTATTFDLRVDSVGDSAFDGGVHFVAIEEGVYDVEGDYKLEAVKVDASATSGKTAGWQIGSQGYQQAYSTPVVVGQVMSANDEDWSVFWSSSTSRTSPASSSALNVGKHVGEDSDTTRATETLGYFVLEATAAGSIEGLSFTAGVGTDTVRGVGNGTYRYSNTTPDGATTAVLSSAGMDGGDGGWAALMGETPLASAGDIFLAIDEDQIRDSERKHTTEQVAYFVIGEPVGEGEASGSAVPQITVHDPMDINGDGYTSPIDVLQLINRLNSLDEASAGLGEEGDMVLDPSGDGYLTPLDALLVINRINASEALEGEASSPAVEQLQDGYFAELADKDEEGLFSLDLI